VPQIEIRGRHHAEFAALCSEWARAQSPSWSDTGRCSMEGAAAGLTLSR
jgi:hypothetical protein